MHNVGSFIHFNLLPSVAQAILEGSYQKETEMKQLVIGPIL